MLTKSEVRLTNSQLAALQPLGKNILKDITFAMECRTPKCRAAAVRSSLTMAKKLVSQLQTLSTEMDNV